MSIGLWALVVVVGLAAVVVLAKSWFDGRFRGTGATPEEEVDLRPADIDATHWGERATLVHFSSAFCAPCRATRQVLSQVSVVVPGVEHAEVDAESHLELVRRLDIRRTPTVLIVDPAGRIRTRASGQPRRADVLAALEPLASRDDVP